MTRDGKPVPAVVQATKTGQLFVLHRETGVPLFPVEERPVPASTIPGEEASPTQPFTTVTPPLSPHRFTADEAWGMTPEGPSACREMIAGLRNEGIFTPPSLEGTLVDPVEHRRRALGRRGRRRASGHRRRAGQSHRGDGAADSGEGLRPRPRRGRNRAGLGQGYEYTLMEGTPYVMRRRLLLGPDRFPCTPPPFGALVAVNLRTGGSCGTCRSAPRRCRRAPRRRR